MSGCGCIYEDVDEYARVIEQKVVVARKAHVCGECKKGIEKGEKYETYKAALNEAFFTQKTCLDCVSVRSKFFCNGYLFGKIWERTEEHVDDMRGVIDSKCLLGLTPRARGRIIDLIDEWLEENPDEDDES